MKILVLLLATLLLPLLQPVSDYGAFKIREKLGVPQQQNPQLQLPGQQPMMQPAGQVQPQPQARVVYHNGQWWKFENNQWYVWTQTR